MKSFGVIDFGSNFIKYALINDYSTESMYEVNIANPECYDLIRSFFKQNQVQKIFLFLNSSQFEVQKLKLDSANPNEGMFLEAEKILSEFANNSSFYIKYNRYQKGLSIYNFKGDLKDQIKDHFKEFELSFLPEELGILNLLANKYLVLDVGHKNTNLTEVFLDRVVEKKVYQIGFANFLDNIKSLTSLNAERSFDLAMDYLKHPRTLNSRQLELVSEAARKFSREFIDLISDDLSKSAHTLILTGGGSFIPELVEKLYAVNQFKVVHLSDLLNSKTAIFNNLNSYIRFILNQKESSNIIDEKLNKLLKVYNLNSN